MPRSEAAVLVVDVVPIEALTSPRDRFRCVPYSTTLSAASCIARQRAIRDNRVGADVAAYSTCVKCEDGKRVAATLKGERPARAVIRAVSPPLGRQAIAALQAKVEETMSEQKAPAAATNAAARMTAATKPATCVEPGCTEPRARVTKRHDLAGYCARHRELIQKRESSARMRGKPAPKPGEKRGPGRPPKAASLPELKPLPTQAGLDIAQLVSRALAVVERLGGIESAERIAGAIGGIRS